MLVFLALIVLVVGILIAIKSIPVSISVRVTRLKSTPTSQTATKSQEQKTDSTLAYGLVPGAVSGASQVQQTAALQKMKSAGFSEIRVDVIWSAIEAVQGNYNWASTDTWLKSINAAGLKPILEIDHIPVWNRPAICKTDPNCIPLDMSAYSAFTAMVATRYKTYNIAAYEIWNEENSINFWKPFPNPNQYAHMLASANTAIKKVDPNATVLIGGLSGDSIDGWGSSFVDPRTFLGQIYAANGKNTFDGIAYHPYIKGFGLPDTVSQFNGWAKMATGANNIRSIMMANGDGAKGVWITEFGVTTGGKGGVVTDPGQTLPSGADHASLDAQATIADAVTKDIKNDPWIKSFIWYDYQDDNDAATNVNSGYGLWQYNGQPKPALAVIEKAIQQK